MKRAQDILKKIRHLELKTRGLLRDVDIERGSGKHSSKNKRYFTNQHDIVLHHY